MLGKHAAAGGLRPQHRNRMCSKEGLTDDLWRARRDIGVCLCMTAVTSHGLVCSVCDRSNFCLLELPGVFFFSCIISSHGWLLPQMWTQKASFTNVLND